MNLSDHFDSPSWGRAAAAYHAERNITLRAKPNGHSAGREGKFVIK